MDRIYRGQPLSGRIKVGGAKNTALPLATHRIRHLVERIVPGGSPGHALLLEQQGMAVEPVINDGCKLCFAGWINHTEAPDHLVRKMCATFLVLGYPLAWMNEALVSLPGD
jgi:UDP-N-acetylglucosamine 1-carboxyvinyltransferase